jgi:hypothetical protein
MSLFLYSTNPKFSHVVAEKYLNSKHFVWCSDKYDPGGAPSSSPCEMFILLQKDCDGEDTHSKLITGYKKTFRRLAALWAATGVISADEKDEIITQLNSKSWNIWRPQLYIICRSFFVGTMRLITVPATERAALCTEWQIKDLNSSEFEIIERVK